MNSSEIFQLIENVAATPGKNDKLALLKRYVEDSEFKRVCEYAYNPFKTFGIAKMPTYTQDHVEGPFDSQTWIILDALISRELTGNEAREAIAAHLHHLDNDSAELFKRIILKDLRAGFSESSLNKVCKGLIPEFPYMRCSLPKSAKLNEFAWAAGCISQEKADGMFANVDHEDSGIVRITSRQGSQFPLDELASIVEEVQLAINKGTQTHGELLVLRGEEVLPRQIGNGMLNSILDGGKLDEGCRVVFFAWDQIPLSAVVSKGKCNVPYNVRLSGLMKQMTTQFGRNVRIIQTKVVKSLPEAYEHYREMLKLGKEGTIIKDRGAIWKDGTSKQQVKLKLDFEVDLEIIGFEAGNGKNEATFGSVICATSDRLLKVSVSGFTDAMRQHIHDNREEFMGSIIAVTANDIMKPSESNEIHSLFLPRFNEARKDKTVADDLARVFEQREAAMEAA